MARPSKYTDKLADEICEEISQSSKGLHLLCKEKESWPSAVTIYAWLASNKEFLNKYARAREIQADLFADQIIEIADDSSNDTMIIQTPNGAKEVENREWTTRSKLRCDARKWAASKLAPKKYGDRIEIETQVSQKQTFEIGGKEITF